MYANPLGILEMVLPADRPVLERALADHRVRGTDTDVEYRIQRQDGLVRWIRSRAVCMRGPDGRVARVLGVAEDVTERKQAQLALAKSQEKFSLVFKNSPVWMTITTLEDGVFLDVNDAFTEVTGYTRGEVLLLTMGCVAYLFCAVGGADSGSFRYLLALYIVWPLVAALTWDSLRRRGGVLAGLGWLFLALVAVGSLWGTVAFSPLNHPEQRAASREMGPEQASLTRALKGLGIRYAYVVDYWLGMKGTFLANEQVIMLPFDHERHPPYKQALLARPPLRGGDAGREQRQGHPPKPGHGGGLLQGKDRPAPLACLLRLCPAASKPAPVDTQAWSLRKGAGMVLWDRDAATRLTWPQEPGTGPTLDLGGQVEGVCQVLIFPARPNSCPRSCGCWAATTAKVWQELARAQPYLPFHWSGGRLSINLRAPWQEIRFAPTTLRYLRLEQGGKAKNIWAINEADGGASRGGRQALAAGRGGPAYYQGPAARGAGLGSPGPQGLAAARAAHRAGHPAQAPLAAALPLRPGADAQSQASP